MAYEMTKIVIPYQDFSVPSIPTPDEWSSRGGSLKTPPRSTKQRVEQGHAMKYCWPAESLHALSMLPSVCPQAAKEKWISLSWPDQRPALATAYQDPVGMI